MIMSGNYQLKKKKLEFLVKKIEGIIFKQLNNEKKNLNVQYDLLSNSENYEVYKEKADKIFTKNDINKHDIIRGQKLKNSVDLSKFSEVTHHFKNINGKNFKLPFQNNSNKIEDLLNGDPISIFAQNGL